jgi:hypothetical protein
MEDAMPKRLLWLLLGAALAVAGAQQENPVTVNLETFLVSEVTRDGATVEELIPTTTALPGEVVEYRLQIVNTGERTLPPGTVMVRGPIPVAGHYLDGSATASSDAALLEFSADGGETFSEPPVMLAAGWPAEIDELNMIRWTVRVPLEPGASMTFVYRVVVRES